MAAGDGSAHYCAPPKSSSPRPQSQIAFLSVGEMVVSAANQTQDPIGFWTQLYQAEVITQNELKSMTLGYFEEHAAPSPFVPSGGVV